MKKVSVLLIFLLLFGIPAMGMGIAQSSATDGLRRVDLRSGQAAWDAVTAFCHWTWLSESKKLSGIASTAEFFNLEEGRKIFTPIDCKEPAPAGIARESYKILEESNSLLANTEVASSKPVTGQVITPKQTELAAAPKPALTETRSQVATTVPAPETPIVAAPDPKVKDLEAQVDLLRKEVAYLRERPFVFPELGAALRRMLDAFSSSKLMIALTSFALGCFAFFFYRKKSIDHHKSHRKFAEKESADLKKESDNWKRQLEVANAKIDELEAQMQNALPKKAPKEFEGSTYGFTLVEKGYTCDECGETGIRYENRGKHLLRTCSKLKVPTEEKTEKEKVIA